MKHSTYEPAVYESALFVLSPVGLCNAEWVKVGMAAKDAAIAFEVFDDWCASDPDGYPGTAALRSRWNSWKPGKVTAGSLIHLAKQTGWGPDTHTRLTIEQAEAQRQDRARKAEQARLEQQQQHQDAAMLAGKILTGVDPADPMHPYLTRKGVDGAGLYQLHLADLSALLGYCPKSGGERLAGMILLAPVQQIHGAFSTLELIDEQGRKAALAGGKKAGGYWLSGTLPDGFGPDTTIAIAEGIATAKTVHQAIGGPVLAALSCHNLHHVAEAMRQRYPAARLLVCGDLGNGQQDAETAAASVGASLALPAFPDGSNEGMSDFNDLHQKGGIDAVCNQLQDALQRGPFLLYRQNDKGIAGEGGENSAEGRENNCGDNVLKVPKSPIEGDESGEISPLEQENGGQSGNQATALVDFTVERMELFCDQNREVFAECRETGIVRRADSKAFREWLVAAYYRQSGRSARSQSVSEALCTLSGLGREEGEIKEVFIRTAVQDGCYYLDLCQSKNSRAVAVRAGSWQVVEKPPVKFFRTEAMQELPLPVPGGNLSRLWETVNIPPESRDLVAAWLIECLRPETPKPVLEIGGEQGSAKSTTQTSLKRLFDPNASDLRSAPKTVEDCYIAALSNWLVSYENISHLHHSIQDAMCIIATGGGYATRKFYTNAEESVINVRRPIVLNGISECVTRQDLVDRTISIEVPVITARKDTVQLEAQYEADRPYILGALLDLFASALSRLPQIEVPEAKRPRLVEFVKLGMAIKAAMGGDPEQFLGQFLEDRKALIQRTLDASPVAVAVVAYMESGHGITATAKQLMEALEKYRPQGAEGWPKSPKGLGDAIKRAAPALRQLDIDCLRHSKQGGNPKWQIRRISTYVQVEV